MSGAAPSARRLSLLLGGAAMGAGLLVLVPSEAGPLAVRAGLATLAVAALAAWAGRGRRTGPAPTLRISAQVALGRAASVAVVEVDGRRFLLGAGAGAGAPALLAELAPGARGHAP